jgi:hypothetical protein
VNLNRLKSMHRTTGAGFSAAKRKGCLRGTRGDVFLVIDEWLVNEKDKRIFWLSGPAGTGKSTIAQTFAESTFRYGKLGASFFCSRNSADTSNLQAIFPTLAFQLARRYPQFRKNLFQVLENNDDVEEDPLGLQLEKLIVGPLKATKISTIIIIDALDECKDKEPASELLSVLSSQVHEIPEVKFFITGRPEPLIREGFQLKSLRPITDVLKLHDVERSSVNKDIRLYLRTELTNIREWREAQCAFPEEWPSPRCLDILCEKAAGLFIYASMVIGFVSSKFHPPTERLDLIISRSKGATHEGGIDHLYTQFLELVFHDLDPADKEVFSRFRIIVGAVLLVFHPLSQKTLSGLVTDCVTPSHISTALYSLHSLLDVPVREDDPIRAFHKSFPDFLMDRTRCEDERFFIDPPVVHEAILFSCLDLMKKRLKKNICDLDDYAVLSEVETLSDRRETCVGSSLEYACRFWTRHLTSVPANGSHVERVQKEIDRFFAQDLLCWIEVLTMVGYLGAVIHMIKDIRQWYTSVSFIQVYSSMPYPHTTFLGGDLYF